MAASKNPRLMRLFHSLDSKELKPYVKKYPRIMLNLREETPILDLETELSITELYERYKDRNAWIRRDTYYDDTTINIVVLETRMETDGEYTQRLNDLYYINHQKKIEKKAREDRELQEYLRLKKRFEKSA